MSQKIHGLIEHLFFWSDLPITHPTPTVLLKDAHRKPVSLSVSHPCSINDIEMRYCYQQLPHIPQPQKEKPLDFSKSFVLLVGRPRFESRCGYLIPLVQSHLDIGRHLCLHIDFEIQPPHHHRKLLDE